MNSLAQSISQIEDELAKNDRLRWGVGAILILGFAYICLILSDLNGNLYIGYQQLKATSEEIAELATMEVWQERLVKEQEAAHQFEHYLWQGESEGRILANFQTRVRGISEESGLSKINIETGSAQPHEQLAGVFKVRARLRAQIDNDLIAKFLHQVETHDPLLVFERLDISRSNRKQKTNSNLDAIVLAYISTTISTTISTPGD